MIESFYHAHKNAGQNKKWLSHCSACMRFGGLIDWFGILRVDWLVRDLDWLAGLGVAEPLGSGDEQSWVMNNLCIINDN
jgi:hypothetical protein